MKQNYFKTNVEKAAAAIDPSNNDDHTYAFRATNEVAATLSTTPPIERKYRGEVSKSQGITVYNKVKNKQFPYMAVRTQAQICSKCYPASGQPTNEKCRWPCYTTQCNRCQFYGHNTATCMQLVNANGENIA